MAVGLLQETIMTHYKYKLIFSLKYKLQWAFYHQTQSKHLVVQSNKNCQKYTVFPGALLKQALVSAAIPKPLVSKMPHFKHTELQMMLFDAVVMSTPLHSEDLRKPRAMVPCLLSCQTLHNAHQFLEALYQKIRAAIIALQRNYQHLLHFLARNTD